MQHQSCLKQTPSVQLPTTGSQLHSHTSDMLSCKLCVTGSVTACKRDVGVRSGVRAVAVPRQQHQWAYTVVLLQHCQWQARGAVPAAHTQLPQGAQSVQSGPTAPAALCQGSFPHGNPLPLKPLMSICCSLIGQCSHDKRWQPTCVFSAEIKAQQTANDATYC